MLLLTGIILVVLVWAKYLKLAWYNNQGDLKFGFRLVNTTRVSSVYRGKGIIVI